MFKIRFILLLFIFLFNNFIVNFSVFALNLEEALKHGYYNNDNLKKSRLEFLEIIESFPTALSDFMPKITAQATLSDSKRTPSRSEDQQLLKSDSQSYNDTLRIEQSIFSAGSGVTNLRAAYNEFFAAKYLYYAKEQEVLFEHIQLYLENISAKRKYEISLKSLESNRIQLDAVKERYKYGQSTGTEIASAEANYAAAKANKALKYSELQSLKEKFLIMFGVEVNELVVPKIPNNVPENLESLSKIVESSNYNLLQSTYSIKANTLREKTAKQALLPRVDLQLTFGRTRYHPRNAKLQHVNSKSMETSLISTIPILAKGGAEYSQIRKAKHNVRKLLVERDNQNKSIMSDVRSNWERFNAEKIRSLAATEAVRAAEIAYNGMIEEEKLGSKTIIDVLNAEERLNKAMESEVDAQTNLIASSYKILFHMGSLTANALGLDVNLFNPDKEFNKIKTRIVGTSTYKEPTPK